MFGDKILNKIGRVGRVRKKEIEEVEFDLGFTIMRYQVYTWCSEKYFS